MTEYMAAKLLREKRVRLKDCKSPRTGKVFTADVLMDIEVDGKPVFRMELPDRTTSGCFCVAAQHSSLARDSRGLCRILP